ncbi:hypothetical protein [Sporosarcina trichiuri]|uniref:hypothetical protein n=1 Tax=Sporosarcina trichiuri TaxID=3056445 RepID=UPI0025B3C263|nr:hypothetical protein [Sporosarcina sp. 0.2-SM1T-5]WJY26075.1 hypothetical protein QWT68_08230 [Sporosarcina sp. 0.2-SM1T-5]
MTEGIAMPVTEYYLLWKVTVPSSWVAAVFGLAAGWLMVRRRFGKQAADMVGDAIFTVLLTWKLSVIVTDFGVVRQSPTAILYFNGGTIGFLAGIVLAALLFLLSKKPVPVSAGRAFLLLTAVAQAGYQILMALLNRGTLYAEAVTILLFGILMLLTVRYAGDTRVTVFQGALLLTAAHGFIAALQPAGFAGIPFAASAAVSAFIVLIDHLIRQRTAGGIG